MQSASNLQVTKKGHCSINDQNYQYDFDLHGRKYSICIRNLLDTTLYMVDSQELYLIHCLKSNNLSPTLADVPETHELIVSLPYMKEFNTNELITTIEQIEGQLFRISTRWSHPLSSMRKENIYIWNAVTGTSHLVASESSIDRPLVK